MFTGVETKQSSTDPQELELRLLVEWEPRWQGFVTSIHPALRKSPRRLACEIDAGLKPKRAGATSALLHVAAIGAMLLLTTRTEWMKPQVQIVNLPVSDFEVLYYSGDELPQTKDVGGAEAGTEGRSGGREAHNPRQAIRVARGDRMAEQIADAPDVKLPLSMEAVANMLALKRTADAGPVPAAAIRSSRVLKSQTTAVEPAPDAQQANLRALRAPKIDAVAPTVEEREIEARLRQFKLQREAVQASADISELKTRAKVPRLFAEVVPPPVSAPITPSSIVAKLTLPAPAVAAPPVDAAAVPGVRNSAAHSLTGAKDAVGPSIDAADVRGGTSQRSQVETLARGSAAPAAPGGGNGTERDSNGSAGAVGRGTPNGNGGVTGVIVSASPGTHMGMPSAGGDGSISMSPEGIGNVGRGGSGSGLGIGSGSGTGSGTKGVGPGASIAGVGRGSDVNAHGGTSPSPGSGGSGSGGGASSGGVSVSGGTTIVNIPSFGGPADPATVSGPSSDYGPRHAPAITIVATSRSGGALNRYGAFQGRVYTIYFDTALGTTVMEYADHDTSQGFNADLTAPEPTRTELPAGLPKARTIVSCVIDRAGTLRDVRVVETKSGVTMEKLLAAIQNWRFRPVLRGGNAIEVDAILGFYIDTR